jgi:signal transduction histidine kinase/DNA-binding response OmpR family regulator/HPt (histidine-containing phosphotransfer) domain-containing protein
MMRSLQASEGWVGDMNREVPVGLGPDLVDRLFPFLLAIDAELRVVKLGRGVAKICTGAESGAGLLDLFTIARPQLQPTFEELATGDRGAFLLESRTTGLRLRGEMTRDPATGLVLFLGSPWFTDLARLQAAGLSAIDFPGHDPTVELLHEVQARTLALQELERANAAKSWFLANTSHELRNPLNGIIGMATLLRRSELKPRQINFVDKVMQSAEMLQNLVNDILDLSKIEAGKLTLEEIDFDPTGLVHDIAGMFSTSAHMKNVELVCVTPPYMPGAMKGDPNRLRQVLSNLVGNAVKFTSAGEIVVRASLEEIAADGSVKLRFSVSDTGIGIAPDSHQLLFQPFSQIDSSMGRRFGGTGLGLAIARQLVELMGGEIGVDSTLGQGSTFWFTCRFAPATNVHLGETESLAGLRVLVVDDNATNRAYLSELVAQRGAAVEIVDSGVEALSAIRAAARDGHAFDFVLLDMHMPGMTGLDVAVVLAADPAFDQLAKVLLTSIDVREDPRIALARVRACMTKPVRPDVLTGCLRAIREGRSVEPLVGGLPPMDAPLPPPDEIEILVVDDNPVNIEVASHMAETLGYRAEIAATGAEAVQAIRRRPYRLVLMDLQMPEMDGYEATREIRALDRSTGAHTPIIAVTARVAEAERRRALGAGFDDYLAKPIPLDELGTLFVKWLGPRGPAAPVHRPATGETPNAPDVIDGEAFLQLRRAGRDQHAVAAKVVRLFLDDLPQVLRAIVDSHQADDVAELQAVAHRMKGSSGVVGALRLHRMCHELETAAHAMAAEARAALVDEVVAMSVEVQRVLEGWLASQGRGLAP